MDEEGASGDSGSASTTGAVQFEAPDPFCLDQFSDTAAAWRVTTGGIGSGSSSCSGGDGGDMNM